MKCRGGFDQNKYICPESSQVSHLFCLLSEHMHEKRISERQNVLYTYVYMYIICTYIVLIKQIIILVIYIKTMLTYFRFI